jgi:hypothetical protein
MMRLALFEHAVAGAVALPEAVHAIYIRRGAVTLDGAPLAEDSGTLVRGAATLGGQG